MGKVKIWNSDRNWTRDLQNTGWTLYPLSYENSWRGRSFNWVHMWQAFCILLGSALSKSVWVVISTQSSVMKCERRIDQHDKYVGQYVLGTKKMVTVKESQSLTSCHHQQGSSGIFLKRYNATWQYTVEHQLFGLVGGQGPGNRKCEY